MVIYAVDSVEFISKVVYNTRPIKPSGFKGSAKS